MRKFTLEKNRTHAINVTMQLSMWMESHHLYGGDHVLITMGVIINLGDDDNIDGVDNIYDDHIDGVDHLKEGTSLGRSHPADSGRAQSKNKLLISCFGFKLTKSEHQPNTFLI